MSISHQIKECAKKLRDTIDHHRYLYHVLDKEEISPEALDSLKHELAVLEERYPKLITPDSPTQRIAGTPLPAFKKVKHKIAQWSFNDAFTKEEVRNFDKRIKRLLKEQYGRKVTPEYTCELKIDGLKIVLTYDNGLLKTAATRGDGKVGEDVTHNVRTIESVPLKIRENIDVIVEGEVWLSKRELLRINKEREKKGEQPFANPRNAAAGSIRQLDPRVAAARRLDNFIYDLVYSEVGLPKTQENELSVLKNLGFKVNSHFVFCKDIEEVILFWEKWQKKADTQTYLIDGVVVKVNKKEHQDVLGYTGKAPRFALALKFPAQQVTTVVEDIVLQVGRTGVLTPVAYLRSVKVAGSVVSRATLHNEDEIRRLDVRVGDTVVLQKAGDVIPNIVQVVKEMRTGCEKKYRFPARVPECGGDGKIERIPGQVAHRCVNKNSFAQTQRKFYHFVSKKAFNIPGLGPRIIDLLLEENLVTSYDDIFTLKKGDINGLPGFAEKATNKLISTIEKSRIISLPKFLFALSIEQVGEETAEDLAEEFGALENIKNAKKEELEVIDGIGGVVARSLCAWFREGANKNLVHRLLKHVTVKTFPQKKKKRGTLHGKVFVLTGALVSMTRDEARAKIKQQGGVVVGAVSKNTDYVVAGAGTGLKYKKAESFGVKILTEEKFFKILGGKT